MTRSLDNISLANLERVLNIATRNSYSKAMTQKVTSEEVPNGSTLLDILLDLGFITERDGNITRGNKGWNKSNFTKALLSKHSIFQDHIVKLIQLFEPENGILSYYPPLQGKREDHNIRNLLIELEIIMPLKFGYVINQDYNHSLYQLMRPKALNPDFLPQAMEEDRKLGLSAELHIIKREVEIENVDPKDITHISIVDCGAGFDIISKRQSPNRDCFLEVKATDPQKSEFNISKNEMETAKFLGSNYALVLVPFSDNSPSGDPEYIWDPYTNLNKSDWKITPTSWKYQR